MYFHTIFILIVQYTAFLLTGDRLKYLFMVVEESVYNWIVLVTNLDEYELDSNL